MPMGDDSMFAFEAANSRDSVSAWGRISQELVL